MPLHPGQPLLEGRFTLLRVIGRGASGEVWEARQLRDGAIVAIKAMPLTAGGHAAADREAEVAVRVRHPALLRVLLTHEEADHALVVMERCEGSLAHLVTLDGPMSPREALLSMVSVLEVLATAHAAGVIHRDVKPHNVLRRGDGSVALGDWGMARAMFGGGGATTTSLALLGTLPYMAPELRKDARAASPAGDLYAAGITLAWLCLGEAPDDPFVPAGEALLRERLPAAVVKVVLKACAWAPEDRYPDAHTMANACREASSALEHAPRIGAGSPPQRPLPGARKVATARATARGNVPGALLVTIGGVAALVAAGVSAWVVLQQRASAPPSTAGTVTDTAPAAGAQPATCDLALREFVQRRALGPVETVGATAGDLDGDGLLDVVFSNQGAETLTLWWGRAGALPTEHEELAVGRVSGRVAVLDTDGDGQSDLVVPHRDEARLSVWRGVGKRRFIAAGSVPQAPAPGNLATAVGRLVFDADGALYARSPLRAGWGSHLLLAADGVSNDAPAVVFHGERAWAAARRSGGWALHAVGGLEDAARRDLPESVAKARFLVPW